MLCWRNAVPSKLQMLLQTNIGQSSYGTQENYGTQDSSGMCHLMPQCHLPEWWEEEQAFVHRCSWMPYKSLDNKVLTMVNCTYMMSVWSDRWHFSKLLTKSVRCNNKVQTWTATVYKGLLLLLALLVDSTVALHLTAILKLFPCIVFRNSFSLPRVDFSS